jgi:hypothetical protein
MEPVPAPLLEAEADNYWERATAEPADEEQEKALAFAVGFYKEAVKGYEKEGCAEQVAGAEQVVSVLKKLIPGLVASSSRYEAIKAYQSIADILLKTLLVTEVDLIVQLFRSSCCLYVQEEVENLFIAKVRETADHFVALGDRSAAFKLFSVIRELLSGGVREASRPEAMISFISLLLEEGDLRGAWTVIEEESRLAVNHSREVRFTVDKIMIAVAQEDSIGAERILKEACLE